MWGASATALASAQARLHGLPLIETHAHLNGSIPPETIAELVRRKSSQPGNEDLVEFRLPSNHDNFEIHDFFPLFGSFIYRLTDEAESITFATLATLRAFSSSGVIYVELRTTPRAVPFNDFTADDYVQAVLAGCHSFASEGSTSEPGMMVKLILSIDRRHSPKFAEQVVDLALMYRDRGVVGVDLCGDPTKGDSKLLLRAFMRAREGGLQVTVHLGEIPSQLETQSTDLLLLPDRLGHATYLSPATTKYILKHRTPIEICLSSNLICKTVSSLDQHHIAWALENDLPIQICTDDPLIFLNPPALDYDLALRCCEPPTLRALVRVVIRGIDGLFCSEDEKARIRGRIVSWSADLGDEILDRLSSES